MTSKRSKTGKSDFETTLKELEAVVERLEDGELPLEQAVKEWERGMKLRETCQKILQQAEQKVDVLVKKGDDFTTEPLDDD